MTLGEKIRDLRKSRGFSGTELADECGVSQKDVSKWENNKATPSVESLIKICKALNISADELLGLDSIERRYIVIDEPEDGNGDSFEEAFQTLKEANKNAEMHWNHLTGREKAKRHILVGIVTKNDLEDYAFDDDRIDWCCYHSYDTNEECFDSNNE